MSEHATMRLPNWEYYPGSLMWMNEWSLFGSGQYKTVHSIYNNINKQLHMEMGEDRSDVLISHFPQY